MDNALLSQPWMPVVLGAMVLVLIRLVWPWLRSLLLSFIPKRNEGYHGGPSDRDR